MALLLCQAKGATAGSCPEKLWILTQDDLMESFIARVGWLIRVCAGPQFSSVTQFSFVQSLSRVRLFATPWITARQASLSITNSWSLLKLRPIELMIPSSHLILCRPLLLLPPIPPSITVFSNESTLCMRWPKYWSFSFSISPSNEHSGLISFRMDWLHLLAVQGTLKSLLQHNSSKASIIWHSAFFTVQLSHPYMTSCSVLSKSLSITNSQSLFKLIQPSHPLLPPSPPT